MHNKGDLNVEILFMIARGLDDLQSCLNALFICATRASRLLQRKIVIQCPGLER